MAPRIAVPQLIALVRAGLLDVGHEEVITFGLEQANEAVAHAATHSGLFQRTVITPGR